MSAQTVSAQSGVVTVAPAPADRVDPMKTEIHPSKDALGYRVDAFSRSLRLGSCGRVSLVVVHFAPMTMISPRSTTNILRRIADSVVRPGHLPNLD